VNTIPARPESITSRLQAARQAAAHEIAPVLELDRALARRWRVSLDVDAARRRLRAGVPAIDARATVRAAGDLEEPFLRALKALERAGIAGNEESSRARALRGEIGALLAAWLGGAGAPCDAIRATARRAAIIVAGSVLRRAGAELRAIASLEGWEAPHCPCCGGHPEFAYARPGSRTLVCGRCDTSWTSPRSGCLACGADDAPSLARVASGVHGYRLAICHPCGTYLKEHDATRVAPDFVVERALTAHLDAAAEARGLCFWPVASSPN
jgi:formate dehydrogenase maturation protein FdhE